MKILYVIIVLAYDDNDDVPNFIWNSTTDEIIDIYHIVGKLVESQIDEKNKIITTIFSAEKIYNWIYLETFKPDIEEYGIIDTLLSVKKGTIKIDSDKIIQKDDKIFILDDPVEQYVFKFSYKQPPLMLIDISPKDGVINQNFPSIKLTFNYPADSSFVLEKTGDKWMIGEMETDAIQGEQAQRGA